MLVFNTCTIREKPDTKLAAYLGDAAARKRERPDTVIAVGGCFAEAQRERLFTLYPQVDVAFGPGTIAHLGEWLGAGGLGVERSEFGTGGERALRRTAADAPRARLPGLGADLDGLQLRLLVLHRAGGARTRGVAPAGRDPRRDRTPRRRGRARADAARAERQLVRTRSRHRLRAAAPRRRRGRRDRPHSLHQPAPEGLPPRGDRGDGRVRGRVRARAPAAAVGVDARPQGDAAHVLARALRQAGRRDACRHSGSRAVDRHHRRLPRRDRGGLPRDARGGGGGRLRRRLHLRLFAARRDGGCGHAGPDPGRGEAGAHRAAGRRRADGRRGDGTRRVSASSRRCWSKGRAAPTRACSGAGRGATRP